MAVLQRHMAKWIRDCNEDVSMPKQACLLKYFDAIRRKKIQGVYIRIWSYKETNRMKEEIGAHRGPGREIWLVALVLGSSVVFRKEPSRLLGSVGTAAGQPVNIWMGSETSLTLNFLTLHIWLGVGGRWSSLLLSHTRCFGQLWTRWHFSENKPAATFRSHQGIFGIWVTIFKDSHTISSCGGLDLHLFANGSWTTHRTQSIFYADPLLHHPLRFQTGVP